MNNHRVMSTISTAGLVIIGVGIGMAATSVIPLPAALDPVKNILWFILIIVGLVLVIKSHN